MEGCHGGCADSGRPIDRLRRLDSRITRWGGGSSRKQSARIWCSSRGTLQRLRTEHRRWPCLAAPTFTPRGPACHHLRSASCAQGRAAQPMAQQTGDLETERGGTEVLHRTFCQRMLARHQPQGRSVQTRAIYKLDYSIQHSSAALLIYKCKHSLRSGYVGMPRSFYCE